MADSVVTVCGNAVRDPEIGFTPGAVAKTTFGVACSRRWQQNGEWQEQTSFFNVVAWARLGENVANSITKGTRVIVTGRLEQREYETKAGEKRSVVEIVADEVGISMKWDPAHSDKAERDTTERPKPKAPDGDEEPF